MEQQLDLFDVTTSPVGRSVTEAEDCLPPIAREILNLVGHESLIRLVRAYGGTHIDFPRHCRFLSSSKVVEALGEEIGGADAMRLAGHFAGVRLWVPKCDDAVRLVRNREICAALDRGQPAHKLARQYKLTERQIWSIAKRG